MKKKVLFVASLFLATATFAQDGLTSKKGEAYLPEAGDYVIGFDGTPFLNYAGNLLNGSQDNDLDATWLQGNTQTLVGKMYKDANTAYRGKLRIGLGSTTAKGDAYGPENEFMDETKNSNMNITLGAGIEKRKGNTRIQGFYGAEAMLMLASGSTSFEYGQALSADNPASRETENKFGSTFGFGARAFAGVEWFIAPKVSLAAEYGWGLMFQSIGNGENTSEAFVDGAVESTTVETGGFSTFGIDTDNNGGAISILFHF
jgi:hypothetical protein